MSKLKSKWCMRPGRAQRGAVGSLAGFLLLGAAIAAPATGASKEEPIVIGQSVPNGMGSYRATVALKQGARAYVGLVNDRGGISGRPIKLVTLDGGNDPAAHAENVRKLVQDHKAVAIVGCAGDDICRSMAVAAAEVRVPLVGALSGTRDMARGSNPWLFTIRPSYDAEAGELAKQLSTLGFNRIMLLTDAGRNGDRAKALLSALSAVGMKTDVFEVKSGDAQSVDQMMSRVVEGAYHAVVTDVVPDTVDVLAKRSESIRRVWPKFVVTLASSSLQGLSNLFPDRAIGFTQVVPNPDANSMPVTVELQQSAEEYANGTAINFDGMAAYIGVKVAVHGIRQVRGSVDGASVAAALAGIERYDLGGYTVSFSQGRSTGANWLTIGMRSRNGTYLK